jgi:hypothetical protein
MDQAMVDLNNYQSAQPSGRIRSLMGRTLTCAAREWDVTEVTGVLLMSIPFLVVLGGIAAALMGKRTFHWYAGEDQFAETLQVVLYCAASVSSFIIARRLSARGERGLACLYGLLVLGLFFVTGEEISWGQRIFGWQTPATLMGISSQGETNIHNIHGFQTFFKWMQLIVAAYGTILPLTIYRIRALGRYRQLMSWLVPPASLVPYFAFMFMWKVARNFSLLPREHLYFLHRYNEVMELNLAMAFFLFGIYQLRRRNHED